MGGITSQPIRKRSSSAPPFPHNEQVRGLIPRPVSLRIPKKVTRTRPPLPHNATTTTFFKAIHPTSKSPSSISLLQDYRSPSSNFSSSAPSRLLIPPEMQTRGPSPPVSPRSTSPSPPLSPTASTSPPLDPTWTKAAPIPPPMPKFRHSSKSSLRLSRIQHDGPLYNTVAVLGSEMKHDFKRNKPYTVRFFNSFN